MAAHPGFLRPAHPAGREEEPGPGMVRIRLGGGGAGGEAAPRQVRLVSRTSVTSAANSSEWPSSEDTDSGWDAFEPSR